MDKDKDPELRHTVLTLSAFHDLTDKVRSCAGDSASGIQAFLDQNEGEAIPIPSI